MNYRIFIIAINSKRICNSCPKILKLCMDSNYDEKKHDIRNSLYFEKVVVKVFSKWKHLKLSSLKH